MDVLIYFLRIIFIIECLVVNGVTFIVKRMILYITKY